MVKKESEKQSKKKENSTVKKQPKKSPSAAKSKLVKPESDSVTDVVGDDVGKLGDEEKKPSSKKKSAAPKKSPSAAKSKLVKPESDSVTDVVVDDVDKLGDKVIKPSSKKKSSASNKLPQKKLSGKEKHGDDSESGVEGGLAKDDKRSEVSLKDSDDKKVAAKPKEKSRVRKSSSAKKRRPVSEPDHPLKKFGKVGSAFIMEHLRTIDYIDIAAFIGVSPAELKEAIEQMGIKVPIERARRWSAVDVGEFVSIENCARCQVQMFHHAFHVGINECRACYEKNIRFWLERKIVINIKFPHE